MSGTLVFLSNKMTRILIQQTSHYCHFVLSRTVVNPCLHNTKRLFTMVYYLHCCISGHNNKNIWWGYFKFWSYLWMICKCWRKFAIYNDSFWWPSLCIMAILSFENHPNLLFYIPRLHHKIFIVIASIQYFKRNLIIWARKCVLSFMKNVYPMTYMS